MHSPRVVSTPKKTKEQEKSDPEKKDEKSND
jgi:hypothetical protein